MQINSSEKVILDVGLAFTQQQFETLFRDSKYHIMYLGNDSHTNLVSEYNTYNKVSFFPYSKLYNYQTATNIYEEDGIDIITIIDSIVNNKLTLEIHDRCSGSYLFNYANRSEVSLISMIVSFYKFLRDQKPRKFILYECPHHIRSWVMGKLCESLGIPVYYCRNNITHWRNAMLKGLSNEAEILSSPEYYESIRSFEKDMFKCIADRYSGGIDAIKPEFKEVMKATKTKKLYSLKQDIRKNWRSPVKVAYKYYTYKRYSRLCSSDSVPDKYIVFFLHLQPERTTLPEGYSFSSLYKAIRILSEVTPNDVGIIVKEHPATFYTHCTPFGRWPGFYDAIASIPKVRFVPLESDPYKLMENSLCVSTITGTVTGEALIMGKPVVNFGLNVVMSKTLPIGLYNFKSTNSLQNFISAIPGLSRRQISDNYLEIVNEEILNSGFCGITDESQWNNSFEAIYNANQKSRFKLIHSALCY